MLRVLSRRTGLTQQDTLTQLHLDNCLSGSLPVEFGDLTKLWHLYLDDNCLSGLAPANLKNATKLGTLAVDSPALCRHSNLNRNVWSNKLQVCPSPAEVPAAPAAPVLTPVSAGTSLRIRWDTPAGNGAAITDYDIQYRKTSNTTWTSHTHTDLANTDAITGLTTGSIYQARTRATNSVGTSGWSPHTTQHTAPDDRAALIALYNSTNGPNWKTATIWNTHKTISTWSGVTVDGDGRVTRLYLYSKNLTGALPDALGDLTHLYLNDNHLTGSLPSRQRPMRPKLPL